MTKNEFLAELRSRLSDIPEKDIDDRLGFYSEIIDDRIEEGKSEEDAVNEIGSIDEVAAGIIAEIKGSDKAKKEKKAEKKLKTWEVILLAVGSPIWGALAISAAAVVFSLWVSLWAVITSIWAAFGAFAVGAVGAIVMAVVQFATGSPLVGLAMFAYSFVLAGLSIFSFFGCVAATKGSLILTKKTVSLIKKIFTRKEKAK